MADRIDGKTVLITGATDGLGRAAALELARRGGALTLVARNAEKGARTVEAIQASTPGAEVSLLLGDLSSQADIRAMAAQFRESHDRLDLLVNNAGAIYTERKESPDGYELTFAVNHLGPFLLTHLLMDLLQRTPGARVVSTSSAAQLNAKLDLATVAKREGGYSAFPAYADSKLCNVLFTRQLQRRAGPVVTASCFHPGFVGTNIGANNGGVMAKIWTAVGGLIARSPEKGADTLVWLATSPEAAGAGGGYFIDRKPGKLARMAEDDALAEALWALSERSCGLA